MFADLDEVRLTEKKRLSLWRWKESPWSAFATDGRFGATHTGTPGESAGAVVRNALAQLELLQHTPTEGK